MTERDVVDELEAMAGTMQDPHPAVADLLNAAAREIRRLRILTGATSDGQSFEEIRKSVGTQPKNPER